jgi:DNA polymerase-3 subunit delta
MTGTVHAFEFMNQRLEKSSIGVCTIFGNERFLKRLAIGHLVHSVGENDPDFTADEFDSDQTSWADVHDELSTRSLFGEEGPRIVVVDHADKFVKNYRERLEDYITPPKKKRKPKSKSAPDDINRPPSATPGFSGLLVLVVDTWPATTRLYKAIDKIGLQIKCDAPTVGKSKKRDDKKIADWLIARARTEYEFQLPAGGAQLIVELTDAEFGRMDQELQKLVLYTDKDGKINQATIKQAVGGWRTRTMWDAIEAATDGDAGKSLELLDQLLRSGDHPLALFGQMAWSLRRYATATEIVMRQLRNGRKPDLKGALKNAGFPHWGSELAAYEARIKQLGSKRAGLISQWLLEADLALKRSHSKEDRGRLILETLFVKMAKELAA